MAPSLVAAAAVLVASAAPVSPTAQDQFEALVREIGALRADLDQLDRQERTLLNEMDRLAAESALHAREMARLESLRGRAVEDLEVTRRMLLERGERARREEVALARQLRAAYEMGRLQELGLLVSLTEPVDAMRAIAYIDVVAARQGLMVAELRRGRAEMEALERALEVKNRSLEDLSAQRRSQADRLEQARARSSELLESTRSEGDAHRSAIAELTRAAEELESAIVSRGPSEAPPSVPLIDVEKLRGALEWPVPGTIDVPYGDIRNERFKTVTPHPGIDIRTEPGAPIRAILPGRVVFSRRFAGYGNTILLDHGGHYLTVYARAAVVGVAEGQDVLAGQVLGHCAERALDDGPPTVYFELREGGQAVDPARWLKRRAATRERER